MKVVGSEPSGGSIGSILGFAMRFTPRGLPAVLDREPEDGLVGQAPSRLERPPFLTAGSLSILGTPAADLFPDAESVSSQVEESHADLEPDVVAAGKAGRESIGGLP